MTTPRPSSTTSGFSLVEVTLAVGIAALGIIAILGLMPQGLEMSRKTSELAAQRHIVEQIIRNLEQRPWQDLTPTIANSVKYFDDQGSELVSPGATMVFVAKVEVFDHTANERAPKLPIGAETEVYLRRVVIRIANTTNPAFDFDAPERRRQFATFNHYIAKTR